ncbi:TIR-like protein FxsC [Streptosporangium sp. NPDC006930]|uniref:TIR-like protein FxsC n=1 Tax=unclassified Streptosporangium TaxID=2632669 RepID=UPI0034208AED
MLDDPRAGPYFFLSYAHTPKHDLSDPSDPDQWVKRLFDDLCKDVMQLSGLRHGASPGFIDRNLRAGSVWPDMLARAIATCRVFVPLYSRRYFESEQCGREWAAFSRRVALHEELGLGKIEVIVPAIWVPFAMEDLPEAIRDIQVGNSDPTSKYEEHGFYGIMKLRRFHSAYELAVYQLARRIVDAGENAKLVRTEPPDYHSVESAFGHYRTHRPNGRRIRVTVVSPDSPDPPGGRRRALQPATPLKWNPFEPALEIPLIEHAQSILHRLGYLPEPGQLAESPDTAKDAQQCPCVVLLDIWAADSAKLLRSLRWLDESSEQWVAVILVMNRADPETAQAEARLRGLLEGSLPRKMATGRITQSAVTVVSSLGEFNRAVAETARSTATQYLRHAPAHPPEGQPSIERPRLQGPQSSPDANDAEERHE